MSASRRSEVLVIGQGLAGLFCALELSKENIQVDVVGRGTPATALSGGCISYDGPGPLKRLRPDISYRDVRLAVESFVEVARSSKMPLVHPDGTLLDAHGLGHEADLCQRWTLVSSDIERSSKAELLFPKGKAEPLAAACSQKLRVRADIDPSVLAQAQNGDVEPLSSVLDASSADLVIIPPIFGLDRYAQEMERLESRSGKVVREAYSPLGLPGRRLVTALRSAAVGAGASIYDMEVTSIEIDGKMIRSASVRSGLRELDWELEELVHCGGGLIGGGLDVAGTYAKDPLGVFDVASAEGQGGTMAILSQGLRVDEHLHLHSHGDRLTNAFAAGAVLPGINPPSGAGLGSVLISSFIVSQEVQHGR